MIAPLCINIAAAARKWKQKRSTLRPDPLLGKAFGR